MWFFKSYVRITDLSHLLILVNIGLSDVMSHLLYHVLLQTLPVTVGSYLTNKNRLRNKYWKSSEVWLPVCHLSGNHGYHTETKVCINNRRQWRCRCLTITSAGSASSHFYKSDCIGSSKVSKLYYHFSRENITLDYTVIVILHSGVHNSSPHGLVSIFKSDWRWDQNLRFNYCHI